MAVLVRKMGVCTRGFMGSNPQVNELLLLKLKNVENATTFTGKSPETKHEIFFLILPLLGNAI